MGGSIVLSNRGGNAYLFFPIAWALERLANGLWHVWWTAQLREYSPGLLTSVLIWMESYFIVFGRPSGNALDLGALWPGLILGTVAAAFLTLYIPLIKGRRNR